jgi:hypothetical protein
MDTIVIVVAVIGVAWFALRRIGGRRRTQDDPMDAGLGMASWLPAWMIFGGMAGGHDAGAGGPLDGGAGFGGDFGGGADLGGGGPTDFGGGGDAGGGFGG